MTETISQQVPPKRRMIGPIGYRPKEFSSVPIRSSAVAHHFKTTIKFIFVINNCMLDLKEFINLQKYVQDYIELDGGTHVFRIAKYTSMILRKLDYTEEHSDFVGMVAMLHDIGKLFVPDDIVHKPGKLEPVEFEIMKTHTTKGYELLKDMRSHYFNSAASIALYHHENWDGSGYPLGIRNKQIPIYARAVSVVDVFDSLAHPRVYKDAWSISDTVQFIHDQREIKFDPMLVEVFDDVVADLAMTTVHLLDQDSTVEILKPQEKS